MARRPAPPASTGACRAAAAALQRAGIAFARGRPGEARHAVTDAAELLAKVDVAGDLATRLRELVARWDAEDPNGGVTPKGLPVRDAVSRAAAELGVLVDELGAGPPRRWLTVRMSEDAGGVEQLGIALDPGGDAVTLLGVVPAVPQVWQAPNAKFTVADLVADANRGAEAAQDHP